MASIDAREALLRGGEHWATYVAAHTGHHIDLTFCELSGEDLRGRLLLHCNLSGARMGGANLDGSTLSDCVITGADFRDASLVNCTLASIVSSDLHFEEATIRNSTIDSCRLFDLKGQALHLIDTEIRKSFLQEVKLPFAKLTRLVCSECTFEQLNGQGIEIKECSFTECRVDHWLLEGAAILGSKYTQCDFEVFELRGGSILDSRMSHSSVRHLSLPFTKVARLDLVGSVVLETDIDSIGPETALLLDTAFVQCNWPKQRGTVRVFGSYHPSPYLLGQPIQDVRGVPPVTRRDAADAQYLVRLLSGAKTWRRFMLQLWGVTSAYGQSLGRLVVASFLLIFLHALALLAARDELFGTDPHPMILVKSIWECVLVFFGVADISNSSGLAFAIFLSLRVGGFLALGVWIAVAATKLSRLGSE